jgi:O-antigen/teichoic acid export membrane protein
MPEGTIAGTFLRGGASMAVATAVQRVLGFAGALVAARIGGPVTFGAYSIGLATAGTAASYVGLGIGTVAARFAGQAPRTTAAYRTTLARVSGLALACGTAAALLLVAGAPALARLVFLDESFAPLVRAAALSGFALILFEALNGFGVGLFDFRLVLTLSVMAGAGMFAALALLASQGAAAMLAGQAFALAASVAATVAFHRRSLLPRPEAGAAGPPAPPAAEILRFGLTQLGATVGVGLASWCVGVLVTRADPTLTEMGFYGVASQFRTLVTLAPTQLSALVLPLLARHDGRDADQERVIGYSTVLCSASAALIGGVVLAGLPYVIRVYGDRFEGALLASGLLILTAVVHMSSSPAINSLMLVNLRAFTWINGCGSAALVLLGFLLIPRYGAAGAGVAWLSTHLLSQLLACLVLRLHGRLAPGMVAAWLCGVMGVGFVLAPLVFEAGARPGAGVMVAQAGILTGMALVFFRLAVRAGLLPKGIGSLPMLRSRCGTSTS